MASLCIWPLVFNHPLPSLLCRQSMELDIMYMLTSQRTSTTEFCKCVIKWTEAERSLVTELWRKRGAQSQTSLQQLVWRHRICPHSRDKHCLNIRSVYKKCLKGSVLVILFKHASWQAAVSDIMSHYHWFNEIFLEVDKYMLWAYNSDPIPLLNAIYHHSYNN